MSIIVRPAKPGDEETCQKIMNDSKNLVWLGGFTMLAELQGRIAAQEKNGQPTLVVVEKDGEVVATSEISPGQHYCKMGLVAVDQRYRDFEPTSPGDKRLGFGSAMYTLHAFRAALEGKLFLLDQTHFLNQVMEQYLPSLHFEGPVVELRQRARNFCSLKFWEYRLYERDLGPWLQTLKARRDSGFEFKLQYSEAYDSAYDKQTESLKKAGKENLIEQLYSNRETVRDLIGSGQL